MSRIVTLTGPSGSGKSTLEKLFVHAGYKRLISHTSRKPRNGEVEGVDYFFRQRDWWKHNSDSLIEYQVFNDNYYGLYAGSVNPVDGPYVVVLALDGAMQVQQWADEHDGYEVTSIIITRPLEALLTAILERHDMTNPVERDAAISRINYLVSEELPMFEATRSNPAYKFLKNFDVKDFNQVGLLGFALQDPNIKKAWSDWPLLGDLVTAF